MAATKMCLQLKVASVRDYKQYLLPLSVAFTLAVSQAQGQERAPITGVKFSRDEIELLRELDRIQVAARVGSDMFKLAPFAELISSPNPVDVAITIATSDWDKLYGALTSLNKIQACATKDAIILWNVDEKYASDKSEKFFENVKRLAESRCE